MSPVLSFDPKREDHEERTRTRRGMTASVFLHIVILLFIVFAKQDAPDAAELVEISLETLPAEAGAPAPAATPGELPERDNEERFRRERPSGEVRPQEPAVSVLDQLANRLANLRADATPQPVGIGATAPTPVAQTMPAVVGGHGTGGSAPLSLKRGGGAAPGPGLEMGRGPTGSAGLVAATAPTRSAEAEAPAQAPGGEGGGRRSLAGASLAGPIADRPILTYVKPVYPEWAKRDAVEGVVTLYFIVRPDGTVKENILVQRTAGFEDFDESARTALRAWRFQALRDGRVGEQWGTITFRFRLEGGG